MRRKELPPTELQVLKEELEAAQKELLHAYARFDFANEPELIDACIYEIKAANARYDYLYRSIREKSGAAAAAVKGGVPSWV